MNKAQTLIGISFLSTLFCATNTFGAVVSTTGDIEFLGTEPSNLDLNQVESSAALRVFDERQSLVLTADLSVETGVEPGKVYDNTNFDTLTLSVTSAGTTVSSHLVHLDGVGSEAADLSGTITFDGRIQGVIISRDELVSTDALLGLADKYFDGPARGADPLRADQFSVSADLQTLSVTLGVLGQMDELRVITSPVPIPAGVWLLSSGLFALFVTVGNRPRQGLRATR